MSSVVYTMVAFNGLFLSANGLFMLVAPETWYEAVPGVTDTGFFNQHFIRDIGIIQLFLGAAFGIGQFRPEQRIGLWSAATLWLSAHAAFHLWEVAVGICSPSAILRDLPAVSLPAIVGAMFTLWAICHAHAGRAVCAWSVSGRRPAPLEAAVAAHPNVAGLAADAVAPADVARIIAKAVDTGGRLDVLVNNAGAGAMLPDDGALAATGRGLGGPGARADQPQSNHKE